MQTTKFHVILSTSWGAIRWGIQVFTNWINWQFHSLWLAGCNARMTYGDCYTRRIHLLFSIMRRTVIFFYLNTLTEFVETLYWDVLEYAIWSFVIFITCFSWSLFGWVGWWYMFVIVRISYRIMTVDIHSIWWLTSTFCCLTDLVVIDMDMILCSLRLGNCTVDGY